MVASLIYVHQPSKGAIYQGSKHDVRAIETDAENYDLVVLADNNYQPKHIFSPESPALIHIPLFDTIGLSENDIRIITKKVNEVSLSVARYIRDGKSVLISCSAGKNRSSLITAFSLMHLDEKLAQNPQLAIDLLRHHRKLDSGIALDSNEEFVGIILAGLPF